MNRCAIVGATFLLCAAGIVADAGEPGHVVSVVLGTGKQATLDAPYGRLKLDCGDFSLESELDLIDSIATAQGAGWRIAFNNGESLVAAKISGEISYDGEFGRVKLASSSIQEMTTVRNTNKRREDGSFNRSHYNYKTRLKFQSGATRLVHLAERDLSVQVAYHGLTGSVWPSRADLVFDWQKPAVQVIGQNAPPLDLVIARLPDAKSSVTVRSDLGDVSFAMHSLAEVRKADENYGSFVGDYTIHHPDGSSSLASKISHRCGDWSTHRGKCLTLEGRVAEEVFWDAVSKIRTSENDSIGTVTFADGKEASLSADVLHVFWSLGTLEIPFARSKFTEIARNREASAVERAASQTIRFEDGSQWAGTVKQVAGLRETTAPGVLHLLEIPVPIGGTWLVERDTLELSRSGADLIVTALGRTWPVKGIDPDKSITIETRYGRFNVLTKEIDSIQRVPSRTAARPRLATSVILRSGEKHEVACEKIQFVRYPDRIFSGTMYNPELGAWFWRRRDSIAVISGDSTTDVQLDRIKSVKFSGTYPSWDVEFEGSKTGAVLKGKVVPEEVARRSPGVSSWDGDREGFWFCAPGGRAFLFIPAKSIAEIHVASVSQ